GGRSDIYAAGLVLRAMVTGKPPGPRVSFDFAGTPPRLQQIIEKCLESEPENRYQSARELAVDLRRLAMPPTAPKAARLQVPTWRRKVRGMAAVVCIILVTAGLIDMNEGRVQ